METLTKIRDLSLAYDVSVRTLRYYEEIGLLQSIREGESTYRSYDDSQVHRLQQILMLRKLNISIKDIKTIFELNQASVLLDILDHKVSNIDYEIMNLHKLKELIDHFIQQLKEISFSEDTDIRLLMDKVITYQKQILERENVSEHEVIPTKIEEVSIMCNTPDVRVISLPACKMVSSGFGNFDEDNFTRFDQWFSKLPIQPFEMPKDFLWFDPEKGKLVWWYVYSEAMDTQDFPIEEFDGGFYVAAVSKDGDDEDGNRVYDGIKKWIAESKTFELDERPNHYTMSHIITTPQARETLGFDQLEILVPVKKK